MSRSKNTELLCVKAQLVAAQTREKELRELAKYLIMQLPDEFSTESKLPELYKDLVEEVKKEAAVYQKAPALNADLTDGATTDERPVIFSFLWH